MHDRACAKQKIFQNAPPFCASSSNILRVRGWANLLCLNNDEAFFYSNNFFSQLHLPVPDMAPEGVKLLLKQCLSATSRDRPSFNDILARLAVFKVIFLETVFFVNMSQERQTFCQRLCLCRQFLLSKKTLMRDRRA